MARTKPSDGIAQEAATKPAPRRRARSANRADELRIRMYRVGFGDCFLVTLPGDRHILIDCGVHALGDIGTLERVIADIAAATRRRVDLIVASHPHEDHVSGFVRGEKTFRAFDIGEIWLPWTEDPTSSSAHKLRRGRSMLARALATQAAATDADPAATAVLANTAASQVDAALDLLRAGFGTGATVRFLGAGEWLEDAAGVPGLRARVVGPPGSERGLRSVSPPRAERLLRAEAAGSPERQDEALTPFAQEWIAAAGIGPRLNKRDQGRLVRGVESSPSRLAFALDRAVNDTSLVCVFSFRGRTLLFPGDAQQSSWNAWLAEDDAAAVLGTIDFYKVSHHGSESATPVSALDRMLKDGLVAMASTQSSPWPMFPHPGLLRTIVERTTGRLARSDVIAVEGADVFGSPADLAPVFEVGPLWIDCRLGL